MADQTVKRQLEGSQLDDLDLEPEKRKRSNISSASESSSVLQHASRTRSSSHCRTTTALQEERKRLLYVMKQVSDETLVKKIREKLQSGLVSNSRLIQSLSDIFDPEQYPPPSSKYISRCADCGKEYDSRYNLPTSANSCRQEHDVEKTSKDVRGTGWECNECGQEWMREWDYEADSSDFGYCYEGLHKASEDNSKDNKI